MKRLAQILFKYRSYTLLPFIALMFYFFNANKQSFIIGIPLIIIGESLRIWGVTHAGKFTRTTKSLKATELITSGPFAYVRNPIYLGNIIIYLAFSILSNALTPFLQIFAFIWSIFQYSLIVVIEEEFLENKFGAKYRDYKTSVPKFIPRLSPYKTKYENIKYPDLMNAFKSETRTFQALFVVAFISLIIYLIK